MENPSNNASEGSKDKNNGSKTCKIPDPLDQWAEREKDLTWDYSPNMLAGFIGQGTPLKEDSSDSNWYFDQIFENPYLSSTLYFYKTPMETPSSQSLGYSEGESIIPIAKCIVRQPVTNIENRFDQTGSTPFSNFNTKVFKTLKQVAAFDKSPFGIALNTQTGMISKVLEGIVENSKKENNSTGFWGTIAQNALNAVTALKGSLNYLNTVQFESDAGLSRAFISNSISSPIHATFFFLQNTSLVDGAHKTNRERAYELIKYVLPYQKLYTSWIGQESGEEGALVALNPEMSTIVNDIRESVVSIAEKVGVDTIYDTAKDLASKIFDGGVITTMSPGGYMTSNQNAIERARKGLPDKRTFMLTTPWGLRMNLLPSNVQVTESQSKVVVNGNKILPMYIQIDIDFISSRRLLSDDVTAQLLNKYKSITVK